MTAPRTTDFLVVGGGIVGLTLALELKRRHEDSAVTVLEKESGCGLHASTRNSGVLHAGFYYSAESLKAQLTRDGNRRLAAYCTVRRLRLDRCGKLVVARNPADLPGLEELLRRGRVNGVPLEVLSADDARRVEPRAKTYEQALFSPCTASVDPAEVIASLVADARAAGITILTGTAFRGRGRTRTAAITCAGTIEAGYVVNAAGLYADRIARQYGFSERYRILPFRGRYLLASPGAPSVRTHIYPVPTLENPFLGVHLTRAVDGSVKIGPTATPALWREQYAGWRNFKLRECLSIAAQEAGLLLRDDFGFRRLALAEARHYGRRALVRRAATLADGVDLDGFRRWGPPGIRAQLFDVRERRLEMDFRYEGDDRSFHVLNAVSPAFTCALSLADYLAERITEWLR
ncbi:MAG TPA: L-2-hydroxyglutarate oxidase [Gemmatimonadales bacterium]|nr:L-2-hydroxyglutarate oxidase [Gemmatimonadales bacterium]